MAASMPPMTVVPRTRRGPHPSPQWQEGRCRGCKQMQSSESRDHLSLRFLRYSTVACSALSPNTAVGEIKLTAKAMVRPKGGRYMPRFVSPVASNQIGAFGARLILLPRQIITGMAAQSERCLPTKQYPWPRTGLLAPAFNEHGADRVPVAFYHSQWSAKGEQRRRGALLELASRPSAFGENRTRNPQHRLSGGHQ